jgi:hypothetical protein
MAHNEICIQCRKEKQKKSVWYHILSSLKYNKKEQFIVPLKYVTVFDLLYQHYVGHLTLVHLVDP